MQANLHDILLSEMQRLCIPVAERIKLNNLVREIDDTLNLFEKKNADDSISAKQKLWERKLLDLSMHNSLLNMRTGRHAEKYCPCSIDVLEDLLADGLEHRIDTTLIESKKIRPLYRMAKTIMEESGANTLFLTFGTMHYEGHSAPLLLLPIDITSAGKEKYTIRKRDEQTMFNFTLVEYLKQNYGIEFPKQIQDNSLPTDVHGVDVNLIIHIVRTSIAEQKGWSVTEDSHIGIFSFTKYIMWNDIHKHWNILNEHPLLQSLIEGRLLMSDDVTPTDARQLDEYAKPASIALPMPADSSQIEAVVDASEGRSFLLYGPPGTGKSQTITNIIANAMYKGKRVLFVAQKKAALDVVEQRLKSIGLAPFCIELHSNKATKQYFLSQMELLLTAKKTIYPAENNTNFVRKSDELFAKRKEISAFINALHEKPGNALFSLQECIEHFVSSNANYEIIPHNASKFAFKSFASINTAQQMLSPEELDKVCNLCLLLDAGESILGIKPSEHPLAKLNPQPGTHDLAHTLKKCLNQLPQVIDNVLSQAESKMNKQFINKSAKEILENNYNWKRFSQIAAPDVCVLDNLEGLKSLVDDWFSNINLIDEWIKYLQPTFELKERGFEDAVVLFKKGVSGKNIAEAIRKGWYRQMAEKMIKESPILNEFNCVIFEQVIEKYRSLTAEFQDIIKDELAQILADRLPLNSKDADLTLELTLLRKRIANKGRGTTIRGIIDQMPHILPYMFPCMLMSPLSVAQYIDIESEPFDLVIFDEASQMPTGEAVGTIARGKAVIVVGDPKQMPPTSFFENNVTDDDEADIDDLDSVLEDFISLGMPSRYLDWHYRSQHESLISFSNSNFYSGKLNTFPSADDMVSHVTHQWVDGFYDYGKSRTNRAEADAIVKDILERLASDDNSSIGIVAFSKQQSNLIDDLLTEELVMHPELEIRAYNREEPLFIKNLENVQGDERDIILFSIGYGPDKDGHVSMNFGPLNKTGGEKRLNVAVSRARKEMKVFSTLLPKDIDERRTNAEGVLGLKRFLEFAIKGNTPNKQTETNKSAIINDVAKKLEALGYTVRKNIGKSAIKVDIAICDPTNANKYLLGIICDGNSYYQLKTTRDREVVQPFVLKRLGWNIMHLWQIDWITNPDMIIRNIQDKITELS